MGAYISLSYEIGGRALIRAWALKGTNMVSGLQNLSMKIPLFLATCIFIFICSLNFMLN